MVTWNILVFYRRNGFIGKSFHSHVFASEFITIERKNSRSLQKMVDVGMQISQPRRIVRSFNCLHMHSFGNDGYASTPRPVINLISMTKATKLCQCPRSWVNAEYLVICLLLWMQLEIKQVTRYLLMDRVEHPLPKCILHVIGSAWKEKRAKVHHVRELF